MRWAVAVAVVALLAGCIQVQVPTAPTAASPTGPVQAVEAAPDKQPVTCVLADQNGTPVTDGACDYRFGVLAGVAAVDANGTAVRMVPTGAKGTVTGSAPGHASAKATLTASGPKTVRMTLPELPATQARAGTAAGNSTATDAAPVDENATASSPVENATVYFDSHRDLLFQQLYVMVPGDPPVVQEYEFTVAPAYQTLEFVGSYTEQLAYAAVPMVKVYGPRGDVVVEYNQIDVLAVATGTGGGTSFPIGFLVAPEPGVYRISIDGAGAPALEVSAFGLIGLAPDFRFTDFRSGTGHHLNDFAGRVVIVDLMASWCGPCNDAMPGLKAIRDEYGGRVEVLSVDVDPEGDPPGDLQDFIDRHRVTWPIGYEVDGSASAAYGTGWIPTMVLIDQHGGLLYRQIGEIDHTELRQRIDAALAAG